MHSMLRLAVALLACGLQTPAVARAEQKAARIPADAPRFVVLAGRTTAVVGSSCDISIELRHRNGNKSNAPATIPILLTVTTLPTLQKAREEAVRSQTDQAVWAVAPATLDGRKLRLAAGQSVLRVAALFPKGQGDVDFELTAQQAGEVRIFVEASGGDLQVQPGSGLILVTERPLKPPKRGDGGIHLIAWQPQAGSSARLTFKDSGLDVVLDGRDFVRPFSIALLDQTGRPTLPPDGTPVRIQLSVAQGNARFDRREVMIGPQEVMTAEQVQLRSSTGGTVEMVAQSLVRTIADAREPYTFQLGARATKLEVQPVSARALANGLDPIAVQIKAVYEDGQRVMKARDEGLSERRVMLSFGGGSARLKDGATHVVIPPDQDAVQVEIFSTRQARKFTLQAESTNGYMQVIRGQTDVEFSLPWWQLASAVVGGLLVPLILRAGRVKILLGGVAGALLYIVMLFGAVLTGEFKLGQLAVALAKLPTENVLAAFVLGMIGYLVVSPALRPTSPPRPA